MVEQLVGFVKSWRSFRGRVPKRGLRPGRDVVVSYSQNLSNLFLTLLFKINARTHFEQGHLSLQSVIILGHAWALAASDHGQRGLD